MANLIGNNIAPSYSIALASSSRYYATFMITHAENPLCLKANRVVTLAIALLSGFFLFTSAPILFSGSTAGSAALLSTIWVVGIMGMDCVTRSQAHRLGEIFAINKVRPLLPNL